MKERKENVKGKGIFKAKRAKVMLMTAITAMFVAAGNVMAFAAPATIGDVVTAASDVTSIVGTIFDLMTANPLLMFFLAASLLGVGIAIFRKLRGATKG